MAQGTASLTVEFSHREKSDTALKGELRRLTARLWQLGYTVTTADLTFEPGETPPRQPVQDKALLPDLGELSAKEAVALVRESSWSDADVSALYAQETEGKARKTVLEALDKLA